MTYRVSNGFHRVPSSVLFFARQCAAVTTITSVIIAIEQNGCRALIPIASVSTRFDPIAEVPPGISTAFEVDGNNKNGKRITQINIFRMLVIVVTSPIYLKY